MATVTSVIDGIVHSVREQKQSPLTVISAIVNVEGVPLSAS